MSVELWSCPNCAFTFDAAHTDADGSYSCPHCAEIRLEAELDALAARLAATEAMVAEAITAMRLHGESCAREDGPFPPDRGEPTYALNRGSLLGQSAGWANAATLLERFVQGQRPGPFHCGNDEPHVPHWHTIRSVTGVCDGRS